MAHSTCQTTKTIVHDPAESVVAACNQQQSAAGVHSTPTRLRITICRLQGGSTRPPCNYRGRQAQHFVEVKCMYGRSMHLKDTHP
ncbi:PREDICTED: LOW QUALITY PROTEIN: angiogenin, partial [Merops nubicus]|uniref:LOW QUALITY PROTEIN: angiogenin n=1 Tax=Merops nubicus TaxID=57421 RepID=UPI0004F06D61